MHDTAPFFYGCVLHGYQARHMEYDMSEFQIDQMFKAIAGALFCVLLLGFAKFCEVHERAHVPKWSRQAAVQVQAHRECAKAGHLQKDVKFYSFGPRRAIMRWNIESENGKVDIQLKSCKLAKKY